MRKFKNTADKRISTSLTVLPTVKGYIEKFGDTFSEGMEQISAKYFWEHFSYYPPSLSMFRSQKTGRDPIVRAFHWVIGLRKAEMRGWYSDGYTVYFVCKYYWGNGNETLTGTDTQTRYTEQVLYDVEFTEEQFSALVPCDKYANNEHKDWDETKAMWLISIWNGNGNIPPAYVRDQIGVEWYDNYRTQTTIPTERYGKLILKDRGEA